MVVFGALASASVTYYTPAGSVTETDNGTNFPVAASVTFTFGNGTVTITLTNLESNTFFDSQNLSGVSFDVFQGATPLTSGASTATATNVPVLNDGGATNIVKNTAITLGSNTINWTVANIGTNGSFGSGNATGSGGSVNLGLDAFVLGISGSGSGWNGTNSIIGATNGSGVYTGTPEGNSICTVSFQCNSGNPIAGAFGSLAQATEEFVYNSLSVTFAITGVTPTSTVSNVNFIFGPDGPDADDFVAGATPEPVSFVLAGFGIVMIAALRLWQARFRFSFNGFGIRRQADEDGLAEMTKTKASAGTGMSWKSWFRRDAAHHGTHLSS
jgi:hypothetical protein